jgi:hypothetical protein
MNLKDFVAISVKGSEQDLRLRRRKKVINDEGATLVLGLVTDEGLVVVNVDILDGTALVLLWRLQSVLGRKAAVPSV